MKALAYRAAHELAQFSIAETEVPLPEPGPGDLLVRVKAVSVNPVDTKVRKTRSAEGGHPVILGWDVAGVVEKVGSAVAGFAPGDEVYYAGALTRDGGNAEFQAVDHRLVAPKPKGLSFVEAAAIPLTALTAWEALFEGGIEYGPGTKVLIIGGAGGVGSLAIQLLKARTEAAIYATASRPESAAWIREMGVDHVLDHRNDLAGELKKAGAETIDVVFSTTHTDAYLATIPALLRAFGHLVLIDDPKALDILPFKRKALRVHWEFMFAKALWGYRPETQGEILRQVAALVEGGKVKTTVNRVLKGLTAANLREAHGLLEAGEAVGKIVIDFGT
ncbi:MAG TPA: zinc-binding alcohol dehydrogenase family protein [Candidatus Methylacidiphilales bacterium]